jgi:hypothetical protein
LRLFSVMRHVMMAHFVGLLISPSFQNWYHDSSAYVCRYERKGGGKLYVGEMSK